MAMLEVLNLVVLLNNNISPFRACVNLPKCGDNPMFKCTKLTGDFFTNVPKVARERAMQLCGGILNDPGFLQCYNDNNVHGSPQAQLFSQCAAAIAQHDEVGCKSIKAAIPEQTACPVPAGLGNFTCASLAADEFVDLLGDGNAEWRLAFRGQAGIDKPVFPAYESGAGIPEIVEPGCKQVSDLSLPCENHYRSNLTFEHWDNIDEVRFILYEDGAQVREIVFDGTGTDYMSWFSADKVKSSTWSKLKGQATNFFSIEGDPGTVVQRKFFINHAYPGQCHLDLGWFVAIDMKSGVCPWEKVSTIPAFKYSKSTSFTNWNSNVGHADVMAIFVKYA